MHFSTKDRMLYKCITLDIHLLTSSKSINKSQKNTNVPRDEGSDILPCPTIKMAFAATDAILVAEIVVAQLLCSVRIRCLVTYWGGAREGVISWFTCANPQFG